MVDASTFHRSIQKIWNYSQQFNDGWMLHDNSNEENAYISKKLKIQIASCILNFEYHVIYNLSYSVPVLFFNIYKSDGSPITNIEDCQRLLNFNDKRYILMQQEHPHLHVPFLTFHPCKTIEIMEAFINKTRNPIVSWISTIAPCVHLHIPMEYAELT